MKLSVKIPFLLFIASVIFLISMGDVFSQQVIVTGNEEVITNAEFGLMARQTNYDGNIAAEIYRDDINTYFAIDNDILHSRYLELRILEQVYVDNTIVHIGQSSDHSFILFLVNTNLIDKNKSIVEKLNDFYTIAVNEKSVMNENQLTEWITEHDKAIKK